MSLAWYSLGPHTVCLEFSLGTADLAHVWAACGLWPHLGSGLAHLCVRSGLSIPRQADRFSAYPLRGDPDQAGFRASAWNLPLRILQPSLATQVTRGQLCLSGHSFLRFACRSASLKLHPSSSFAIQNAPTFFFPRQKAVKCEGAGKEGSTGVLQTYLNWIQFPPTHIVNWGELLNPMRVLICRIIVRVTNCVCEIPSMIILNLSLFAAHLGRP